MADPRPAPDGQNRAALSVGGAVAVYATTPTERSRVLPSQPLRRNRSAPGTPSAPVSTRSAGVRRQPVRAAFVLPQPTSGSMSDPVRPKSTRRTVGRGGELFARTG